MADGHAGIASGGQAKRANDVRADWRDACLEPLLAAKLNRAHSERAEEFRPTWQCVLDRKTIMGQSGLFLQ